MEVHPADDEDEDESEDGDTGVAKDLENWMCVDKIFKSFVFSYYLWKVTEISAGFYYCRK